MFNRASSLAIVLALPLLAAATGTPPPPPPPPPTCNTGPIQCCNSLQSPTSSVVTTLAALLGIVIPNIEGLAGLTCVPLTIIGGGGNSCSTQPVCCTNNNFNGVINFGCSPVNL